ncbi:MAG TPA: hypothetical protein VMC84_09385 [Methanocella sp.]|uniref:hypothetical protein n=1 Tax=Methanocella sp. TaxID=2052833 RepID=UPI002CDA9023|nr:hypothetical protein [Methanocella sp.]HTY91376.1 hypothetical protein [Methanocella sp.]
MEERSKGTGIKTIAHFMFGVGVIDLIFIFLLFAIAQAGFLAGAPISRYNLIIALAFTAIASILLSKYGPGQNGKANLIFAAAALVVFLVLLLASGAIADSFYDVSYDGQWYHQGAIYLLMNGFNPIYQQTPGNFSGGLYIDHYPLGFETASAVITSFTHHIEDGKLLNVFLMVTSFLLIFPIIFFAFPEINQAFTLIVSLLCAFNPVCIYQSLSYYVDGASASLLAILVFLLILAYKKLDRLLFIVISLVVMLSVNIKFFNLAYVIVLVVGFIIIAQIGHRTTRLHYLLVFSLLIGLLFGAHPYIANLVSHGTPFYPVNGLSPDMISGDTPANLAGKNSMEQLVISLFARADTSKSDALLKVPLTYTNEELRSFTMTDPRVGGFGPMFSAVVILTILYLILIPFIKLENANPLIHVILPMCLLLIITVLINPASWWARYVPQLWLVPILLMIDAWQRLRGMQKLFIFAMVMVLIMNIWLIASSYYSYQENTTYKINQQIDEIRPLTQHKIPWLYCGAFPAVQDRYIEHGINFTFTDKPPDDTWAPLAEVVDSYGQVMFYY